jgi:hypothetical protein
MENLEQLTAYVREQAQHHNAYVIDEKQQELPTGA